MVRLRDISSRRRSLKASFYEPGKGDEARARGLYQRQRNAQGVVSGELLVNEHADT